MVGIYKITIDTIIMPIIEFFTEKSGIDSMDNLVQIDGESCFESSVSVAIEY